MIRSFALAAVIAILPLSAAVAGDEPDTSAAEARIEAAAQAFEARMQAYGARMEAASADTSLTQAQREAHIAAIKAEYEPQIGEFTASITQQALQLAQQAMAGVDVDAIVTEALNDPEVKAAMEQGLVAGTGVVRNSAWTNPDPEQLRTYGLVAQYALDSAADALDSSAAEASAPAPDTAPRR